ncbi:hypothetical protein KZZ52_45900 [Dactylosporangium sp. AC04546]|uniref:hypothetical protein n=1 Tax=Dactylosporangium sp. AC04546 TaxID=2862460 RepID=UPI001EE116CD|nr:hypothetical protein [Dactylosporangium sp. AC04546]WVK81251.1 hypothetical protein KZZ52_45900 [Dactylosporangium sp. AC04546]
MLAQDSPFRPFWWGIGLEDAGVGGRPDVGTYGRYEFEDLPPVPFAMSGDLSWLSAQPEHGEWCVGEAPARELPELRSACARIGLALPPAFVRFMGSAQLQRRVRSCTACYVDLSRGPARAPAGDGYLVRFLADQQGCLYWYLFLTGDGRDHAVVCSSGFFDPLDYGDDDQPDEVVFCGESFETFLCRYWLENEIWFADTDHTAMPAVGAEYLSRYQELSANGHSVTG